MDSSKFVNAYIENAMAMIQEQTALVLQLKTQAKVANDIIAEIDERIAAMEQEVERSRIELTTNKTDLSSLNEKINEIAQLKAQLEHMNTFANQINEMKQMIKDRDLEIVKLKKKSEPKSTPKKDINKKELERPIVVMEKPIEEQADDF